MARVAAVVEARVEVVEASAAVLEASEFKVIEVEANVDWRLAVVEESAVILPFKTWKLELRVAKLLDKLVPSCKFWIPSCCDAAVELASELDNELTWALTACVVLASLSKQFTFDVQISPDNARLPFSSRLNIF